MNLLEMYVTNITSVETGLPYNSVRITADFDDLYRPKEIQVTKIIHVSDYEMIKEHGYYLS